MPKLLFSICCQLFSIDHLSNNLSLFHIIEQLQSSQFPFQFPQLFVASLWQRQEKEKNEKFEVKIRFLNPSHESKNEWTAEWQFASLRHRHILGASNLTFDIPGTFTFEIYIRKKGQKDWDKPVIEIQVPVLKTIPQSQN